MKIQASIRAIYEERKGVYDALKNQIDAACGSIVRAHPRWHYESRVKSLESFSVKIESGRVKNPHRLEDLFACTFVVTNSAEIGTALGLVSDLFKVQYRRPPTDADTKKRADSFPFDDLRLYCCRGNDGRTPAAEIDDLIFEVQIKTFLQHAWGIATHDLSYKTDDVRWGKDRIVAHLKAAIEYAEISIQQAEALSRSPALELRHSPTTTTAEIIEILKKHWLRDDLPENLRGLAETVRDLLDGAAMTSGDLDTILSEESQSVGALPSNLSPYGVILQTLLNRHTEKMKSLLEGERRFRVVLTPELTIPVEILGDSVVQSVILK